MKFLGNTGTLEVAGHAVLDAVSTPWVNLIALEQEVSVLATYIARLEGGRKVGKVAGINRGKEPDLYLSRLAPAAPGSTLFVGPSWRHWNVSDYVVYSQLKGGQNLGQRLSPSLLPRQQAHREA